MFLSCKTEIHCLCINAYVWFCLNFSLRELNRKTWSLVMSVCVDKPINQSENCHDTNDHDRIVWTCQFSIPAREETTYSYYHR